MPGPSVRTGLLIAFGSVVGLVAIVVLSGALIGTRHLASDLADPLVSDALNDMSERLGSLITPVRRSIVKDYVALRLGNIATSDARSLKNAFTPGLYALSQVGSMMLGDLSGRQFLVMRYDETVTRSPLLHGIDLPPPPPGVPQFFTREVRSEEWGETAVWTLWSLDGRTVDQTWKSELPGYNPLDRPWHRVARDNFRDLPLNQALALGEALISWTDVYTFYTSKTPGISASVAARDPSGRVHILAYDLLLDEINSFARSVRPTANTQVFVLTEDGHVLGGPSLARSGSADRSKASPLEPLSEAVFPQAAQVYREWRGAHASAPGHFRTRIDGSAWWAGFRPYEISNNRHAWIAVLMPESDLVPKADEIGLFIILVSIGAAALAVLIALWMARAFARPLSGLAEESDRIAALDLEDRAPVRSRFVELRTLSSALSRMRGALRQHIAEQNRSQRAIFEREQQLRALTENTPDVIMRFSREKIVLVANRALLAAIGIEPAQAVGRPIGELGLPVTGEFALTDALDASFSNGIPSTVTIDWKTPSGTRTFESRLAPEMDHAGETRTVLVVSRDISARMAAERSLRASEARYRTLIESTIVGIVVHQDGVVRFANSAAEHILGLAPMASRGSGPRWESFVAPEYRDEIANRAMHAMRGKAVPIHPGWKLLRSDGSPRWVTSSVARIEWEGAPALILFLRDTTDLQLATAREAALQAQLRQSQKMEAVGLLAAGIAHDFNNLLQIIGGNASLAMDPTCLAEDRITFLSEVGESVRRATEMTRKLLAFSSRQPLHRQFVDLGELVERHLDLMRRMMPETIRLVCARPAQALTVHADRSQLEQVLLNLCVNARDAMPNGGELRFELGDGSRGGADAPSDAPQRAARLTVSDTGIGMTPEVLGRIFEPFYSTKPRDKGTGLGLSVAYGIIQQHNGSISAASNPGLGTTFTILLPLAAGMPAANTTPSQKAPVSGSGTILLAEDNGAVRSLAGRVLKNAGYTVIEARDGTEAWTLFQEHHTRVDLLFLDVMMPGMSGFEVWTRCRTVRPGIEALFASGYAAGSLEDGTGVPDDATILQKPYSPGALLENLAGILSRRSGR